MAKRKISIRLSLEDWEKVQAGLQSLGQEGDKTARSIKQAFNQPISTIKTFENLRDRLDENSKAASTFLQHVKQINNAYNKGRITDPYTKAFLSGNEALKERNRLLQLVEQQAQKAGVAVSLSAGGVQGSINAMTGVSGGSDLAARGADVVAYGQKLDQLRAQYVPLYSAQQKYKQMLIDIRQAHRLGAISQNEMVSALARTKAAFANQVTSMGLLGRGAKLAGKGYQNMGLIVQQAGYQISDVAAVAAAGGNALATVGTQLGQFLGFLGPKGALIGAGVTILGLFVANMLKAGGATEQARYEADLYQKSLTALTNIEKQYNEILRERQGLPPLNADMDALKRRYVETQYKAEDAKDSLSWYGGLWSQTKQAFGFSRTRTDAEDAGAEAADAKNKYLTALEIENGTEDEKIKAALQQLNEEREREISLLQMSSLERQKAEILMEAELQVRKTLKDTWSAKTDIEEEVKKARDHAAAIFDQKQAEEERNKILEEGKKIKLAARDANEIYADSVKRLNELLSFGAIDETTYTKRIEQLNDKRLKDATDSKSGAIRALDSYAKKAADTASAIERAVGNSMQELETTLKDVVTGSKSALDGLADFADSIFRQIANSFVQANITGPLSSYLSSNLGFFSGGSSGFLGTVGSVLSSFFHEGGRVGDATTTRQVPSYVFAGAPRYHSGGLVGLKPDERPAILQTGEFVVPRGASVSSAPSVTVNVINNAGADIQTSRKMVGERETIEVMVDKMISQKIGQHGSSSNRAIRQTFNTNETLVSR